MVAKTYRLDAIKRGGGFLGLLGMIVWCLCLPQAVATGINRGLSVCANVVIPTLYPFMLLAGILSGSPLCRRPGQLSEVITRWLFGLPGCCGPAILMGLLGGYPAGALVIGRLRKQALIEETEARRMTLFCINAGPGFIISTVGSGLLGSPGAGLLLFAAHAGVSIITGILLGKGHRQQRPEPPAVSPPAPSLAATVADTCQALLTMCGFVMAAAALLSLIEATGIALCLQQITGLPARYWSAATAGLLEVSSGCIALAGTGEAAPFWLCLCLGWGGLSVQGQLVAALGSTSIVNRQFYIGRLLHGISSGAVALLLFRLFPAALPTVGGGTRVMGYTVSVKASIMLLLLSFLAMCIFSSKSTGKSQRNVV
ncbi:MAG: hypothetical protein E7541_05165 [Ruminococcaceae bacterium]|nr:hypothetical protein [Oscillospiraceae bacterium]